VHQYNRSVLQEDRNPNTPHNVQHKSTGTGTTLAILIYKSELMPLLEITVDEDIINICTVHLWSQIMHIMDIIYMYTPV